MEVNKPLVSVIIPTYNRPTYLKQALDSVSNQTYHNIDILVIDDGSELNYAKAICSGYSNCKYFYKKNGGLSSARNYGIRKAKGQFISFLDDDDFWREDKIEKQVILLEEYPKVDCIHSSAMVVNEKGEVTGEIIGAAQNKLHKRSGYVFWNALGVWVVKSPTPLIRKKVFQPDLMFDETIKVGEDIDFYQRMFYRHKVLYINEPLAFYREYNNIKRLSLQKEKYIGIEKKMFLNFKKMGIKNPFTLHLIAVKLLKKAIKKNNSLYCEEKKTISRINIYFLPRYFLNRYF